MAGVALGDMDLHLRGRRGTWRHRPSLCVAGVDLHFAWQAWHLWHWAASGRTLGSQWMPLSLRLLAWQAWRLATWTFTLRGRRGTWRHGPSPCLAGVARMALGCLWWRAWFPVDAAVCRRGCWRGKRGTWRHRPSLCAAGVALPSHGPSLCVAGVALGDMDLHFAWQAWHLWHWAASDERLVPV